MKTILLLSLTLIYLPVCFSQTVIINEFQSSNDTTISDFSGDHSDWFELYNPADSAINLEGWFLSDDAANPFKWKFPSVIFPSEGYLLVFASDKDTIFPNGEIHTNFKLSNGNEPLLISRSDSTLSDITPIVDLQTDWSYGRYPDATSEWFYFEHPTPGLGNSTQPYGDFALPPVFSHAPGFYAADFYLEMSSQNPNDTIYYTLDGSPPTNKSQIYSSPILMKNKASEPNNLSLIRTTLPGQGFHSWSPPTGIVYKFNVVRARIIKTGCYPSEIISSSYIVDPVISSKYTFPIISLITDSLNFFCDTIGIYKAGAGIDSTNWLSAHFSQEGMAWERPVHFELFEPNGSLKVSQDAGIRIHGGFSATANIKSLRLYARNQYGRNSFNHQFFPKLNQSEFKTFILRNAGQDFAWCYMRDAFMQSLVDNMGFDTQDYQPAIVFLNGEYWGIHYITERYDKHYIEANYAIPEDSLDFLEFSHDVIEGTAQHYDAMTNYITSNNMSDPLKYAYVKTQMDVDNYINYISSNIFFCQSDWPQNNIKYWRKRTSAFLPDAPYGHDGRWRWMLYDTDYGFGRVKGYDYDNINLILYQATGWSPRLMQNLIGTLTKPGNPEFRNNFINTMADMMNSNFNINLMLSQIQQFKSMLLPEIPSHIQRWNGIGNMTLWNNKIQVMIDFAINRPQNVRNMIVNNFASVTGTAQITLNSNIDNGKIKINKLTIDNQTLGLENPSQPYPWSGIYFQGVPVQLIAIPEPGYAFVEWQGISFEDTLIVNLTGDATFTAIFERTQPIDGEIVINEINYHCPNNKDAGEWLEIFTNGSKDFKTLGWNISTSSGFEANLPDYSLQVNQYLVICNNGDKFHSIHPNIQNYIIIPNLDFGDFSETIYIKANQVIIDSVNFTSENPWPKNANGKGPTLELINSELDNNIPQNWQASYVDGGTPGRVNSTPIFALRINEFMADNLITIVSPQGLYADWIELYNPLEIPLNIADLYITDNPLNPTKFHVPSNSPTLTEISPGGYLLLWADEKSTYGPLHLNFKLSKSGEFIGIYHGLEQKYIDSLSFGEQQSDISMGRIPDGKNAFVFFNNPTPQSANGFQHLINITEGWSGISSFLNPYQSDFSDIFSENINQLIILYNNTGIYWPGQNINSLSNWNTQGAFIVKTTDSFALKITALASADRHIQISAGWSIIPCLKSTTVTIEELFEEVIDSVVIIKEIAGIRVYWPAMEIFTLDKFEPGKAYLILSNQDFDLEFSE